MLDMSEGAVRCLHQADKEAAVDGHDYTSSVHLLLALVAQDPWWIRLLAPRPQTSAAQILRSKRIHYKNLRSVIGSPMFRQFFELNEVRTDTSRSTVLIRAELVARELASSQTETKHILIAFIDDALETPHSYVAHVLKTLKVNPLELREAAIANNQKEGAYKGPFFTRGE